MVTRIIVALLFLSFVAVGRSASTADEDPISIDQRPPLYAWVTIGHGEDLMATVGNDGIATIDWKRVKDLTRDSSAPWQARAIATLLQSVHDGTARTADFKKLLAPKH